MVDVNQHNQLKKNAAFVLFWIAADAVGTDGRIYRFWRVVVNHHQG
jgi:hypothetical protein